MSINRTALLPLLLLMSIICHAQVDNPFESIGKKGKILTLSNGRYVETFDYDSIQRIGSVLINIRTRKVVSLLKSSLAYHKFSDNSSASRWWSPDPVANKFPEWTPYNFANNNPIRFNDPEGKAANDIVTFNDQGHEISRIKSNTEFKTYVVVQGKSQEANYKNGTGQAMVSMMFEAPMPGVAAGREDPKYQQNDYQIAASTFLMNRAVAVADVAGDKSGLPTPDANHTIGTDLPGQLDVNVVKAMVLTETQSGNISGATGTGQTDVMQSNVPGDWNNTKSAIGLTNGQTMTPETSINAGVKLLFMKGMGSDANGVMNWRNGKGGDWSNAVQKYNGGGDPNYAQKVNNTVNSMQPGTSANY
jgi:hypothetical protein